MKTRLEKTLVAIRNVADKKGITLSCKLYYNVKAVARREQFVANIIYHGSYVLFRTDSMLKSARLALKYVKEL